MEAAMQSATLVPVATGVRLNVSQTGTGEQLLLITRKAPRRSGTCTLQRRLTRIWRNSPRGACSQEPPIPRKGRRSGRTSWPEQSPRNNKTPVLRGFCYSGGGI